MIPRRQRHQMIPHTGNPANSLWWHSTVLRQIGNAAFARELHHAEDYRRNSTIWGRAFVSGLYGGKSGRARARLYVCGYERCAVHDVRIRYIAWRKLCKWDLLSDTQLLVRYSFWSELELVNFQHIINFSFTINMPYSICANKSWR